MISVEDRILFNSWSKEIRHSWTYQFSLTTCEIKFDLPPKSTNILYKLWTVCLTSCVIPSVQEGQWTIIGKKMYTQHWRCQSLKQSPCQYFQHQSTVYDLWYDKHSGFFLIPQTASMTSSLAVTFIRITCK